MKTARQLRLSGLTRQALLCGLLVAMLGIVPLPVARADTLTVCASGCNYKTIQAAISAAGSGDVISVLEAVHTEAAIAVRKNVTIQGQGAGSTIVQAQTLPNIASSRVFAVSSGVTATIQDMTIRHGNVEASPARGGGVYNSGTLTLRRVTVTINAALGVGNGSGEAAYGGGILNEGTLTIQDSTISGNTAQGGNATSSVGGGGNAYGGGVYNDGSLSVQNSTIGNNTAQGGEAGGQYGGGGDAYGGGLYNNGELTLQDSTVDGNAAQGGSAAGNDGYGGDAYGGGVAQWWSGSGTLQFVHSTISDNLAQGGNAGGTNGEAGSAYGAGFAQGSSETTILAFTNCTISGNTAQGGQGGTYDGTAEGGGLRGGNGLSLAYCTLVSNQTSGAGTSGGGLHSFSGLGSGPELKSSIAANNSGPSAANGPDLSGNIQSQDYNLIENTNGYTFSGAIGNNIEGSDPQLDPLSDNGGPTHTHALRENSPAINQIPSGQNGCGTTVSEDQRGVVRPQDGTCDIGAFELERFGMLEVAKVLLPDTDSGTFHLQIDGITYKENATDGDSTGTRTVHTGAHTVGEVAGTFSDLDDYNSSIECRDNGGLGSVVASSSNDAGPLPVTVNEDDDIVCTITNERKTGQLEVVKDLIPDSAPGRFHLRIDGVTKKSNAGDGGTTGKVTVYSGTRTVAELAGTSTSLADYNSSIECRDNSGVGSVVASGSGVGPLPVPVNEDDDIVCIITNERKTGDLEVVKNLIPSSDSGKFNLQIDGVTKKSNAGDGGTTGTQSAFTGERTVGEVAGTGTNLADYNSDIECRDNGGAGAVVASGSGAGPLPVTVDEGDDIVCTISNERKTGELEVVKDLIPGSDNGRFDLQIDGVTEKSNAGDGATTDKLTVNTGERLVGEVAGTGTDLADYHSRIECRDSGGQGSVVASGNDAGPLPVMVNEGDDIVCTITNERRTGQLEVAKVLDPDTDPGRFHLQIDGVTEKANAGHRDTTGLLTVSADEHTVGEVAASGTDLDDYGSRIECRDNGGGGIVVASSEDAGPLPVTVNESDVIVCTITNGRRGKIIIEKDTDPAGEKGFAFTDDIEPPYSFTLDHGEKETFREVEPGIHSVSELVSGGWYPMSIACDDPDGGSTVDHDTATVSIDLDGAEEVTCTFLNTEAPDLSITKSAAPAMVEPGESIAFTLVYANDGSEPAPDVTITDLVPDALIDVQFESDPDVTPVGTISYTWDVGDLAPGDGGVITVMGVIDPDLTAGLVFTNTASMDTSVPEWNSSNSTDSAVVTVIRTAPLAVDDAYTTPQNTRFSSAPLSVLDNDIDLQGDPLTAVRDGGPQHGTLNLSGDGTFVYMPDSGFVGDDTFTYYANDGALDSNVATVTITVTELSNSLYLPLVVREWP